MGPRDPNDDDELYTNGPEGEAELDAFRRSDNDIWQAVKQQATAGEATDHVAYQMCKGTSRNCPYGKLDNDNEQAVKQYVTVGEATHYVECQFCKPLNRECPYGKRK